jgi:hypothetical protein
VEHSADICRGLEEVRKEIVAKDVTLEHLHEIQNKYSPWNSDSASVILDLFMAYRRARAWDDMINLIHQMPPSLQQAASLQEQYGMALGRRGDFVQAEQVLNNVIITRGPMALTYCLLGVVRKNRVLKARENGNTIEAQGAIDNAIDAFCTAFKLDPRLIFAGINLVLLMEINDPKNPRLDHMLCVVRYFIHDALDSGKAGFWEHAAALELAVLDNDHEQAIHALGRMLVDEHEPWMPVSTLANLKLLREQRETRNEGEAWYAELEVAIDGLSKGSNSPDMKGMKTF